MYWPIFAAAAALFAAIAAAPNMAEASVKRVRPSYWPKSWPAPPAEFLVAVAKASEDFKVASADLIALAFVEGKFNPFPRHRVLADKWRKVWQHQVIGKSGKKWGAFYRESDWHAYGIMGLMPFNFVGVPGGLPAGAPLRRGLDISLNVRMAARLLRGHYDRTGDWVTALRAYNPGGGEKYYEAFREAKGEFERARATT
jgi:hypothetical protein